MDYYNWFFITNLGCLILIVPVSFALFMETDYELQKIISS